MALSILRLEQPSSQLPRSDLHTTDSSRSQAEQPQGQRRKHRPSKQCPFDALQLPKLVLPGESSLPVLPGFSDARPYRTPLRVQHRGPRLPLICLGFSSSMKLGLLLSPREELQGERSRQSPRQIYPTDGQLEYGPLSLPRNERHPAGARHRISGRRHHRLS